MKTDSNIQTARSACSDNEQRGYCDRHFWRKALVTFGRESNYGYGRKADFHAVERHGSRSVNTIFKGAVDTNVILLTLAHPQPLFFYAYLQPFSSFVTKINDSPKKHLKMHPKWFSIFRKNQRLLLLSLTFEVHLLIVALFWLLWGAYSPLYQKLPFPITLKFSVIPAFRHKNAPQLRLYQNWGANMAKDSNFDTMHPLDGQGVHFCFVEKLSFLIENWRGCN